MNWYNPSKEKLLTWSNWLSYTSLVMVIVSIILAFLNVPKVVADFILWSALVGFGIGSLFWICQYQPLIDFIKSPFGRWIYFGLHALIAWHSIVLARTIVVRGIGLPPQDFDSTVSLISLISFPIVWGMFASLILLVIGMFYLTSIFAAKFIKHFKKTSILYRFWLFVARKSRNAGISEDKGFFSGFTEIGRALGCLALVAILFSIHDVTVKNLAVASRWIAYYVDYRSMKSYPCSASDEQVVLHENGIISTAKYKNGDIIIEQRMCPSGSNH